MSGLGQKTHDPDVEDERDALRAENARLRCDLSDAQHFLEALSETTSELFWRTDADHKFTYMSPGIAERIGVPVEQQLGKTRAELADDDLTSARWKRHLDALERHEPFYDFRYTRKRSDGAVKNISTTGKPVFDISGTFTGYMGVARDITDELDAEARAQTAEANLFSLINDLDAVIALWDADDRLVICNENFRTMNQATIDYCQPGVLFEDHLRAVVESGSVAGIADGDAWVAERLQRRRVPGDPFEVARTNGKTFLVNEARLADGGTIMMTVNITAQKVSENALRKSEQRMADFGSIAADWFWEMDADLRFTYVSVSSQRTSGVDASSHVGLINAESKLKGVSEAELAAYEALLDRKEPFTDFRFFRLRDDGEREHLSISGKPIFDENQTFQGYRGVGRNISDLVQTEQALRVERDKAEEASKAKSQFLAHMSHELRTPLNAILGFSEMIRQQMFGPLGNESYVTYAQDINNIGQHLLSLINDLLDLSRIEAGRFELQSEIMELEETVEQCRRLFGDKLQAREISLAIDVDTNSSTIHADRRACSQMLFNLLSNAEKFNEDGGDIALQVGRYEDNSVFVSVTDTGCGFEVAESKIAMAPFGRIENPLTKSVPGTGLGLPIVKALVDLHDGTLTIDSTIGVGTKVVIRFPPERTVQRDSL